MIENLRPWVVTYIRSQTGSRITLEHIGLSRDAMITAAIQWAKKLGEQTLPGWKFESIERPR